MKLSSEEILAVGKKTLSLEATSLSQIENRLNSNFVDAVKLIYESKGRVIVTGIGKSANIANKIVATFNSTGTPAIFMHAADAIHGDLGNVQKDDVVICLSKSGNTPEIKVLVPLVVAMENPIIAICGNEKSQLAQKSTIYLDTAVEQEACPNNLAPTTSTTAQLAMGDALAVALLKSRGFSDADFARYHPGGALGKQLYLKVRDLVDTKFKPVVSPNSSISEVILEISENMLGVSAVIDGENIAGIITDGDLRRMMEKSTDISSFRASDIMGKMPVTIEANTMAAAAVQIFKSNNITQILVMDEGKYFGVLHFHALLREGLI